MHRLPPLPTSNVRLPIAAASAEAWCHAWVTQDAQPLQEVLWHDPTCVLWAVCQSGPLASIEEVADWLLSAAVAHCFQELPAETPDLPLNDQRHWADFAAESILVAELAAALAAEQQADAGKAYLLGLLHKAHAWLGLVSGKQCHPEAVLPTWLSEQLPRPGEWDRTTSPATACVAEATGILAEQTPPPAEIGFERGQAHRRRLQLAKDWSQPSESLPDWWLGMIGRMAEFKAERQATEQRQEARRLHALAEFAAGAGHEINNPLATISGRAQLLARSEASPDRRHELATIHAQATRIRDMIADLMLFAHPPQLDLRTIDFADLVRTCLEKLQTDLQEKAIQLSLNLAEVSLSADATQLSVAVLAILRNALQAMDWQGHLEISLVALEAADLIIRDDGIGMSAEIREHAFDPFFSGRAAGRGLGFGLCKAWRITQLHGGTLSLDTRPGCGTTVRLRLPLSPAQPQAA